MIKRAYEYETAIKNAVQETVQKITKGDVVGQGSYSQSVSFEHDVLHSIEDVSYSAVSCRLFENSKVGNATVNDPSKIEAMIKNAQESSQFGERIEIELPSQQEYTDLDWLYTEKNIEYNKKELTEIAESLKSEIKKFAPDSKVSTTVSNSCSYVWLRNTNGFEGTYQTSSLYMHGGIFELGEDDSFLELYESEVFHENKYDFTSILSELEEHLTRSRISSPITKTGTMPVIFASSVVDLLLAPFEISLNSKTISKNLSLLSDKLGDQIIDSKFTLIDDPFYYHGAGSAPFDDEGTVGRSLDLIKEGVVQNFIYDCTTATKLNAKTTGHASRGTQSLPIPALTNRVISTGDYSLNEMISSIDYGLLLVSALGEGQSNVIAGDFSVLGDTVYLIENGILKGKVKDIMLSGNAFDLLKNIPMIGDTIHKEYSLYTPYLLLDGVKVSKR